MTPDPADWDGRLLPLWHKHHEDKPCVTLLCGADRGRCQKRLGKVWATPAGLLLHYFQHVAPRRFGVDTSALTEKQLLDYLAQEDNAFRRFEPGQETGIAHGLRDEAGLLALVDDATLWHPVEAGCFDHDGLVEVDREELLALALSAVRKGRHNDMRLHG